MRKEHILPFIVACLAGGSAWAQAPAYPSKPIRIVIALAPGGGVDTTGRLIGSIASDLVAKAPPDGYTILVNSSGVVITPSLMKIGYDPHKDLMPVTMAFISPGVMVVHPSVPVKNVKELIAFAKARPNELFYSSSGQGSAQHLSMALFCQMTGLKMEHVPYKGTAPSILDVVAGRISVTVASVVSTRPMFTTGKLRALATVGNKRTPALPEYPTVAESGLPGFGVDQWYAVFLPGGTSKEIATKLQEAVAKTVLEPETRKNMLAQGMDSVGNTQAEFTAIYNSEIARWAKVVKSLGLQAN
jgi:tripartite-type tricarboxylate transporter receptor subunit TctC